MSLLSELDRRGNEEGLDSHYWLRQIICTYFFFLTRLILGRKNTIFVFIKFFPVHFL